MPALQPQPEIITLEQYEALPEDKRVEVFDGVVYDMASPSQEHQTISMELSTVLNTYIKVKKGSCRVFHAPFDVKLSDQPLTIVQPDLMFLPKSLTDYSFPFIYQYLSCSPLSCYFFISINTKNLNLLKVLPLFLPSRVHPG